MQSRGQGGVNQSSRAAVLAVVPDPRRSGNPSSQEEMAAWHDQALHSWHTAGTHHRQPFPRVPLDTGTRDLAQSLLLPEGSSRCLPKTLLWGSSDIHELLAS